MQIILIFIGILRFIKIYLKNMFDIFKICVIYMHMKFYNEMMCCFQSHASLVLVMRHGSVYDLYWRVIYNTVNV